MSANRPAIGLIGCGRIASAVHARVLARHRRARLAAIADPLPAARAAAAGIAPQADIYDDPLELLTRSDLDAVVICAPSDLHAGLATVALDAGKHVYVEKPIATTLASAEDVAAAARGSGLVATVGFNRRFHPLFEFARARLWDGAIGPVRAISTVFCEPTPATDLPDWKTRRDTGGGVMLDLASHHIDVLRWMLGEEVEHVDASIWSDVVEDDSARLRLSTTGGVSFDGFFSFHAARSDAVTLIGERGVLRFDRYRASISVEVGRRGVCAVRRRRAVPPLAIVRWRARRLVRPAAEPSYARALGAFIDRVAGREIELPTLEDGLRSLETVLAAEASAARIRIPEAG